MIPLLRILHGGYQHSQMIQHAPFRRIYFLDVTRRKLTSFQPNFPSLNQMIPKSTHHSTRLISPSCSNSCPKLPVEVVKQTNKTLWLISLTCCMVIDMACTLRMFLPSTTIGAWYDDSCRIHSNSRVRPNMDQLPLTESLMCMVRNATSFLSDYHRSRSQVCVNPCASPRRNDIISHMASPLQPTAASGSLLSARNLFNSEFNLVRGPGDEPSWGW